MTWIRKYKIVCNAAEYPEQADTYVVVDVPSGEVLSQHECLAEARAVVRRYESADAKRGVIFCKPSMDDSIDF